MEHEGVFWLAKLCEYSCDESGVEDTGTSTWLDCKSRSSDCGRSWRDGPAMTYLTSKVGPCSVEQFSPCALIQLGVVELSLSIFISPLLKF